MRDAALRRLHRLTALAAAGAAALVAVFAGLAAGAVPGRKPGALVRPLAPLRLTQRHVAHRREKHRAVRHVAAPVTTPAPAPSPPPVAPAPTPAPPVVVSGGS